MLHLSVITPEETAYEGDADSVTLPTADGEITILPQHVPLIGIVVPGTMIIREGGREEYFAVSRGVVEIDGKSVRILADSADRAEALEEAAIEAARARAEKLQTERRHDAEGFAEATAILERELARIKTLRRHRTRRGIPSGQE